MKSNSFCQLSCIILTLNIMTKCLALSETSGKSGKTVSVVVLIKVNVLYSMLRIRLNVCIYTKGSDLDDRCNRTVEIYQTVSGPQVTDLNRGKPLHCTYRIRVRPQRDDWIVFVRFTRMRVGEPSADRQKCVGGYVQIVDGYRETNQSNKDHSGETSVHFYCLFQNY